MISHRVKLLLISGRPDDHQTIRRFLVDSGRADYVVDVADGPEAARRAIEEEPHDIFLFRYPFGCEADGGRLLHLKIQGQPESPLMLLVASEADLPGEELMHLGVSGFLTDAEMSASLLDRMIRGAISHRLAELALKKSERRHRELGEYSSAALHNIKNLLNTVGLALERVQTNLKQSKASSLLRVKEMIEANQDNPEFFTHHPKGKLLPGFFMSLATVIDEERQSNTSEINQIIGHVQLMRDGILTQQSHAKSEITRLNQWDVAEVVEEALKLQIENIAEHQVEVQTVFECTLPVTAHKSTLIHILVNLVKNGVEAILEQPEGPRKIVIHYRQTSENLLQLSVTDSGCGIPKDRLEHLCVHGFTTKADGHGFGLAYCARAMKNMGGRFALKSDGPGKGATFTLFFPRYTEKETAFPEG